MHEIDEEWPIVKSQQMRKVNNASRRLKNAASGSSEMIIAPLGLPLGHSTSATSLRFRRVRHHGGATVRRLGGDAAQLEAELLQALLQGEPWKWGFQRMQKITTE